MLAGVGREGGGRQFSRSEVGSTLSHRVFHYISPGPEIRWGGGYMVAVLVSKGHFESDAEVGEVGVGLGD